MDNSYWFQARVHFPPIPGEWKNPYKVSCSLPVELLLEWTNTLTGTKQPKLVRSIQLSWGPWLDAYSIRCKQRWWHAYMHMHTSCFSPWIRGSEHVNSVDTSRSFAFPVVPGLIVTFSNAVILIEAGPSLSLLRCTYALRRLWGKSAPAIATESTLITSSTLLRCTCSPCCALGQIRII